MDPVVWQRFHPNNLGSESDEFSDELEIQLFMEDSSSEEDTYSHERYRSRSANKDRRQIIFDQLLRDDYWGPSPVYNQNDFKARFCLPIGLFDEIVGKLEAHDRYFVQKRDACNILGLSARQKVCNVVRILASGVSAEQQDDCFRMAKTTTREAMMRFCSAIIEIYGDHVLRKPTIEDLNKLLKESNEQGWPGYIG